VKGRRVTRREQLMDDPKEQKGDWKLKEEKLRVVRIMWRTGFVIGFRPVVRHATE
jgi:hypothetical protein